MLLFVIFVNLFRLVALEERFPLQQIPKLYGISEKRLECKLCLDTHHDSQTPDVRAVRVAHVENDFRGAVNLGLNTTSVGNVAQDCEIKVGDADYSYGPSKLAVIISSKIDHSAIFAVLLWQWVLEFILSIAL